MERKIKWGIIGLGKIATKFAQDLTTLEGGELFAVASRSQQKADEFAVTHHATKAYGDYQSLMADAEVEVIYVATPHVSHAQVTMDCLNHGKAVLCEKPFAMNLQQVEQMLKTAAEKKVFLMEALWTRFFPSTQKVLDLIHSGEIGAVRLVQADFGFIADFEPEKRLFNKSLGGGALLDIGIYPLYLSMICMGLPQAIQATAYMGPTDVDHSVNMMLKYGDDQHAMLSATLTATTQTEAWIHGSKKSIHMHQRFHHCDRLSIYNGHELESTLDFPFDGIGYHFEITEVMNCLRSGQLESKKMSHQDSRNLMQLLDQTRKVIGLNYEQ